MTTSGTRLTIFVSGMIAADCGQGGAAWAVLQYVRGLAKLGHDVYLVEPIAQSKIRPDGAALADSANARYFAAVVSRFGLHGRAALLLDGTTSTVGVTHAELVRAAARADVLLNISGMLQDAELLGAIPCRVYLDLDPAFNQLWHATQHIDMRFDRHTHFATVGQAVGTASCVVPTCGRSWIPVLPPVVLADWPPAAPRPDAAFTTVANWRAYGSIKHEGVAYGQKAHSLRRFFELPAQTDQRFDLALSIDPAEVDDLEKLAANRWHLVDPREAAATPDAYQEFIRGSKAEFGIAKSGYVVSRCGWFSDRSAGYLASGRPVLAQHTGFDQFLPTGEGLLAFETMESAVQGVREIAAHYPRHCSAARRVAVEYFDSDRVLSTLLDRVGGAV